jgi:uncharacterized membrane protein YhaH (DUF805 family)
MFEQSGPRIGVSDYWLSFLASYGVFFAGIVGLVFASFTKSGFFMLVSILALLGSSIYMRIAQMQRCNDIGWPWQTPWVVFGVGLAVSVISQLGGIIALLMLPMLIIVGLADFAFAIVLGCIPSRQFAQPEFDPQAYRDNYRDYGAPNFSAAQAAEVEARKKVTVAAAQAATPTISASGKRVASVTQAEPAPLPPRAVGFGRKGVLG